MHPLAHQVFKHVHALERLLRRGRVEAIPLELIEQAQDELRRAGFCQAEVLAALGELETRLWRLDRVEGIEVREIALPATRPPGTP